MNWCISSISSDRSLGRDSFSTCRFQPCFTVGTNIITISTRGPLFTFAFWQDLISSAWTKISPRNVKHDLLNRPPQALKLAWFGNHLVGIRPLQRIGNVQPFSGYPLIAMKHLQVLFVDAFASGKKKDF